MAPSDLDRLLVTLDVDVHTLAFCHLQRGRRLLAPPVDAIMVHYVLEGTMHLAIPGNEVLVCGPGCIAVIPPSVPLYVAADDDPRVDVDATEHAYVAREGVLMFDEANGDVGDLRYVSGVVLASFAGSFGLFDRLDKPIRQHLGDLEIVRNAYKIMLEEMEQPALGARALTSALMKACLVLFLRHFMAGADPQRVPLVSLSDPRLSKAVDEVLARPSAGHSVASMAASAGMSRATFSRRFPAEFAMRPMEFVAKTRLHHAAQLLRTVPVPVKVIAGIAGFASRSHFSRAFKASYGLNPTAYREKYKHGAVDPPPEV